jgi:hypothetical protein
MPQSFTRARDRWAAASLCALLACGGPNEGPSEPPAPRYTPTLPSSVLPELLRPLRLGDSTIEQAQEVLAIASWRVHEHRESYFLHAWDPYSDQEGAPEVHNVFNGTRRWMTMLTVHPVFLRDDSEERFHLSSADLYFDGIPRREGLRLVRIDFGYDAEHSVCAQFAPLVSLERCPPQVIARARREPPDGEVFGCMGDDDGDLAIGVLCSSTGIDIEVIDPRGSLPGPAPALAHTPLPAVPENAWAPEGFPPESREFHTVENPVDVWMNDRGAGITCIGGSYAIEDATLSRVVVRGSCRLTLVRAQMAVTDTPIVVEDDAQLTLVDSSVRVVRAWMPEDSAAIDVSERGVLTVRGGRISHVCEPRPLRSPSCYRTLSVRMLGMVATMANVALTGATQGNVIDAGGNSGFSRVTPR